MRQRELNHEMRNLAAKLTPAQRREKRVRKAQEAAATAKSVCVAALRVADLSSRKLRKKVDITAQQCCLTGLGAYERLYVCFVCACVHGCVLAF